jgi:hypothetical protein
MPIIVPTLFRTPPRSSHSTTTHVAPTRDVWQLRRHFPLPRRATEVRATPRSRAFTAAGNLSDLITFYERRLRHEHVRWHATDRTAHRHVVARVGRLTLQRAPVGYLAIRRTDVGLGIVVKFRS